MGFQFSTRSANRMAGVHPDLVAIAHETIRVSPIDFGIPADGGLRTAQRQNAMYRDPLIKTNCDGYEKVSRHQIDQDTGYGHALDVFAYLNGEASWDKVHLALIAGAFLSTAQRMKKEGMVSIDVRWGGTFGSDSFDGWDFPHFEVAQ